MSRTSTDGSPPVQRIVLYDADCGVCDSFIQFVMKHDPERVFQYAPLGGATAGSYRCHDTESLHLVVDRGRADPEVFVRAKAVQEILASLDGAAPQRLSKILRTMPAKNLGYGLFARIRRFVLRNRPGHCALHPGVQFLP